jgi:hypothetical protein
MGKLVCTCIAQIPHPKAHAPRSTGTKSAVGGERSKGCVTYLNAGNHDAEFGLRLRVHLGQLLGCLRLAPRHPIIVPHVENINDHETGAAGQRLGLRSRQAHKPQHGTYSASVTIVMTHNDPHSTIGMS